MHEFNLKVWLRNIFRSIVGSVYFDYQPVVMICTFDFDRLLNMGYHVIETRIDNSSQTDNVFCYAILRKKHWKFPGTRWKWFGLSSDGCQ